MYKPFSSVDDKNIEKSPHSRPWADKSLEPKVYMWASSIPEKWLKIKGQTAFQHVSETGQNRDTLDFLKSNQKYISAIADPMSKTPSNVSVNTSRRPSRAGTPVALGKDVEAKWDNQEEDDLNSVDVEKSEEFKNVVNFVIPGDSKKLLMARSMKSFQMEIPEIDKGYMINRYSLPKLLVKGQKVGGNAGVNFKNKKVNQFLNRFEDVKQPMTLDKDRRGLNGWKLVAIRKKF